MYRRAANHTVGRANHQVRQLLLTFRFLRPLLSRLGIRQSTSYLEYALSQVTRNDDFLDVRYNVRKLVTGNLFEALWPIALQERGNRATEMAACMLAAEQPAPTRNLGQLLSDIHASGLDAGDRSVPFYLVAEFGKQGVLGACAEFLDQLPEGQTQSRVAAVRYWARHPASELCKHLHAWVARDTYGANDGLV